MQFYAIFKNVGVYKYKIYRQTKHQQINTDLVFLPPSRNFFDPMFKCKLYYLHLYFIPKNKNVKYVTLMTFSTDLHELLNSNTINLLQTSTRISLYCTSNKYASKSSFASNSYFDVHSNKYVDVTLSVNKV